MAVRTAAGEVAGPPRSRLDQWWDGAAVVVLAAVAAGLRAGPLGPSSLWLDDAWTALVVRADTWAQAAGLAITAPGFGLLLRAWLAVVGFGEAAAQAPAYAFGVLGPPAVYIVAIRARLGRIASAVGAALLVVAPAHLTYATRVKQYTLDAVLATLLIALVCRVIADPSDGRRWAWLVSGSALATLASAAVAPVIAAAFAAGLLAARQERVGLGPGLVAAGAYGVAAIGWYLAFLRPSVSPALRAYWSTAYIDLASGAPAAAGDLGRGLAGVASAFSAAPVAAVAGVIGVAAVVVARRTPPVAVVLVGPVAVAVALAAARLAPLGGGRTDVYLLPGLALLCAFALDAVGDRRVGAAAAALALAASLTAVPVPRPYPDHDVGPLVTQVEAELGDRDVLLVYSATRWAYGLYTRFDVAFPADPTQGTGFDVAVDDPRVRILDPRRERPDRYAGDVATAVRGAQRVWLLASGWRDDLDVLELVIGRQGLREAARLQRPGGLLVRWER